MSSEEASTKDIVDSLSEVSSLDNDFDRMHFEPASFDEKVTNNGVNLNVPNDIYNG